MGVSDVYRLTTHAGDYKSLRQGISSLDFDRFDPALPLNAAVNLHRVPTRIAIVKKNKSVLTKLVKDLNRITAKLADIPALIIDDESDQASINTSNPDKWAKGRPERTAINGLISELLHKLPRGQYVGYTATPFANVFVDPSDAVDILRVSSAAQAETDYDREGLSLPAQRNACTRKATSLEASVVGEFVERGESGRSTTRRSALAAMLTRLKARDVDYVVVHKVDRLARKRADDSAILAQIQASGAQLVSVSENIDETPSGMLLHGIMASIAEFYSMNLATEVLKGATEKAKHGGTPYRAPLGYRNVRELVEGREVRTIALDPERAPLIREAFQLYATGDYSQSDLATILEVRGLRTPATASHPAKVVEGKRLSSVLRNPFYIGQVRYRGKVYHGRHPKLIDEATFEQVQTVLAGKRTAGERPSRWQHYLRGISRLQRLRQPAYLHASHRQRRHLRVLRLPRQAARRMQPATPPRRSHRGGNRGALPNRRAQPSPARTHRDRRARFLCRTPTGQRTAADGSHHRPCPTQAPRTQTARRPLRRPHFRRAVQRRRATYPAPARRRRDHHRPAAGRRRATARRH